MRYEGICCGTCGWFSVESKDGGDCHHTSAVGANDSVGRHKDWWCENWISVAVAEARFLGHRLHGDKVAEELRDLEPIPEEDES